MSDTVPVRIAFVQNHVSSMLCACGREFTGVGEKGAAAAEAAAAEHVAECPDAIRLAQVAETCSRQAFKGLPPGASNLISWSTGRQRQ